MYPSKLLQGSDLDLVDASFSVVTVSLLALPLL